jgi:hypothetical protein
LMHEPESKLPNFFYHSSRGLLILLRRAMWSSLRSKCFFAQPTIEFFAVSAYHRHCLSIALRKLKIYVGRAKVFCSVGNAFSSPAHLLHFGVPFRLSCSLIVSQMVSKGEGEGARTVLRCSPSGEAAQTGALSTRQGRRLHRRRRCWRLYVLVGRLRGARRHAAAGPSSRRVIVSAGLQCTPLDRQRHRWSQDAGVAQSAAEAPVLARGKRAYLR